MPDPHTRRASPGERLLAQWRRLEPVPGGRRLFGWVLGRTVPYTGTIRPYVEALEPGFARVRMRDRRAVRNHLDSVHAVALMNLAEVATGLALTVSLPAEMRSILTGLSIEYLKKARGPLVAECRCPILEPSAERREYPLTTAITDAEGDAVARAEARWLVGPR